MISESAWVGGFCRLYSLLLYGYPSEFRREFGRPMAQLVRDRCRDVARGGQLGFFRFAAQVLGDWLRTTVRERVAEAWSAGLAFNTVAWPKSPRTTRTHWPSFRSMAG